MQLSELERALHYSWSQSTSADPKRCSVHNPAWGQCAISALVVQDYFGGTIVWAQAILPDSSTESHYFNLLNGTEVDVSRAQFPLGTHIARGIPRNQGFASTREYVLSYEPTVQRYKLLSDLVKGYLE